jgi:hypothetical protein
MTAFVHHYKPRSYFKSFHSRTQRFACIVVHRRGGKTYAVINDMVVRGLRTKKKNWRGGYIAPFLGQEKDAAWQPLLDAVEGIPGIKISKSDLTVTFPNGARIRLYGADNQEAIRGGYLDYAAIDEYGDIHPSVLGTIVMPMLSGRRGVLVIIGTPKGQNQFFARFEKAQARPDTWYHAYLPITKTGEEALSYEDQREVREELEDPEWNQEFLCSWTAEFRGSYYATQLEALRNNVVPGRIGKFPYIPGHKVFVAMDVGRRDATAMWYWQYIAGRVNVFKYFERTGLDADEACDVLDAECVPFDTVFLPHDATHETFQSRKSALDTFISRGLPARKVPNPDKGNRIYHGIDASRKVLRTYPIDFDEVGCKGGLEALANYSRKYDQKKQVYSDTPNHDKWSHGADGFRYAACAISPTEIARSKERAEAVTRTVPGLRGPLNNSKPLLLKRQTLDEQLAEHERKQRQLDKNKYRVNY